MNFVFPKVLHSLTSFYIPTYSSSIKFYARFGPLAICRVNDFCKREKERAAFKLGLRASGRGHAFWVLRAICQIDLSIVRRRIVKSRIYVSTRPLNHLFYIRVEEHKQKILVIVAHLTKEVGVILHLKKDDDLMW